MLARQSEMVFLGTFEKGKANFNKNQLLVYCFTTPLKQLFDKYFLFFFLEVRVAESFPKLVSIHYQLLDNCCQTVFKVHRMFCNASTPTGHPLYKTQMVQPIMNNSGQSYTPLRYSVPVDVVTYTTYLWHQLECELCPQLQRNLLPSNIQGASHCIILFKGCISGQTNTFFSHQKMLEIVNSIYICASGFQLTYLRFGLNFQIVYAQFIFLLFLL